MAALRLSDAGPDAIREAVRGVLTEQRDAMPSASVDPGTLIGRLPPGGSMRMGAAESLKEEAGDRDAAEYFQSLLELAYLAASADGLAEGERDALAALIEHATGAVIDAATLKIHFEDLDATMEILGRRERLGRTAANFEGERARAEAIGFATLVAMADGVLAEDERAVLVELGAHFELTDEQVGQVIERVAAKIEERLA